MKRISEIIKNEDTLFSSAINKEINMLLHRKNSLKGEIEAIDNRISAINQAKRILLGDNGEDLAKYDPDDTWKDKIATIIKSKRRSMTTNEIVDEIKRLEDTNRSDRSLLSSVSSTLSAKAKVGEIFERQKKHGVLRYSLKEN